MNQSQPPVIKPRRRRRSGVRTRYYISRGRRFVVEDILHAHDPPHSLALGAAIGMFITFTPTIGFQMYLTFLLAWLFRANKLIGVPLVWISNPFTMIPIFWINYEVGRRLLGFEPMSMEWWKSLYSPPPGWWGGVRFYWIRFADIATPLWFGSFVVGAVLGVLTYLFVYVMIRWYRLRRFGSVVPHAVVSVSEPVSTTVSPTGGTARPHGRASAAHPVVTPESDPHTARAFETARSTPDDNHARSSERSISSE